MQSKLERLEVKLNGFINSINADHAELIRMENLYNAKISHEQAGLKQLVEDLTTLANDIAMLDKSKKKKAEKDIELGTFQKAQNKLDARKLKHEHAIRDFERTRDNNVQAFKNRIQRKEDEKAVVATQIESQKASMAAEATKQKEKIEDMAQFFQDLLDHNEYYYVQDNDLYYLFNKDEGKWSFFKPQSMAEYYTQLRDFKSKAMFTDVMHQNKRMYKSSTLTFNKVGAGTLNMIRTDHWLKPQPGKHHMGFDLLLWSMAGGKQENFDHLEQVIRWKYLHPEDFLLPCIVVYGEGGVGKDLFVSVILRGIFGKHYCSVIDAAELTGFNELIMGKAVVYISEACSDRADMTALKRTVGNSTIPVNIKFGPKMQVDNTALYMIGTNDPLSAVQLGGDGSDRRWSVIKTEKTLLEHINERFQLGLSYTTTDQLERNEDVIALRDEMADGIFKNLDEVAKWLNHIITKWAHHERPAALHGEDFQELLNLQKGTDIEVMEKIFNDEDFTYVSTKTLYEIYKAKLQEEHSGPARGGWGKKKFNQRVKDWLRRNQLAIVHSEAINIEVIVRKASASGRV